MRAFIKNYLEAEKARREEEGREGGFSLIELIVVVVILGILAAVAIPIFLNIQGQARDSQGQAAAANGATQAAAVFAQSPSASVDLSNLESGDVATVEGTWDGKDIDTICVTATVPNGADSNHAWTAGPRATPVSGKPSKACDALPTGVTAVTFG
ncbi:type II secretion system protein [Microbacterium ureisolvens]|uniref:type II secretion system protein n=1 Tax=Microbacterium ureisolvens TaxID=2781186 RepID=UPI003643568E